MSRLVRLERRRPTTSVATAIASLLAEHDLSPSSQRVYASALRSLQHGLGADTPLAMLDEPGARKRLAAWFPLDRPKALTREQIASLWRRDDVALRERAFWRLLYESAARANEILSLNIEDLDLANKRARFRSKGGAVEWVFWRTGAALLLPRLLVGRTTGPVFLADRQPTRVVPSVDLCPHTGRARLSYRRAAELFSEATTPAWTLHQLRHSALTHAAEDGTNTPILRARSRHTSVRSLERYARPGPEAVTRYVAEHDPARWRQ